MTKKLSLGGFYSALGTVFSKSLLSSFDYVDVERYCALLEAYQSDKKRIKTSEALEELECRISEDYFKKVFLAQTQVMHYASVLYPAYMFIMSEDLAEDWLAIVDFHKKYARDHSLHQPLTAYIVAELLGYGNPSNALKIPVSSKDLLSFCTESIFTSCNYVFEYAKEAGVPNSLLNPCGSINKNSVAFQYWMDLFYRTALLSALFHDMGYPWQYLGRIGYSLGKSTNALKPSIASVSSIMDRYKNRMVLLPFRQYQKPRVGQPSFVAEEMYEKIKKAMEQTHGLPGGIAFLELNDAIRSYPCNSPLVAQHDFSIEWAAMGIVMHDMVSQHKKDASLHIDFLKDPLSSIVSLADYLEEFHRPNVSFTHAARSSKIIYSHACEKAVVSVNGNTLNVEMKYAKKSDLANANHFKKEETEDYFGGSSPYIDMKSIGVDRVVFKAALK